MSWKLFVVILITIVLSVAITVNAGSLTPTTEPAVGSYTLKDIFNRLSTNATAISGDHDFSPTTTPQSIFPTLTEIYEAIPTIDPTRLFSGTSYLGVTGSLVLACATSTFDGTSNLVADIFDGSGNGASRWCMKDTGDSTDGDIILNKKAWVDGVEITGTMPVRTSDNSATTSATSTGRLLLTPPAGYYDGVATVSTTSENFTAENIKTGINLFGILGTMSTGWTYGDNDAEKVLTSATAFGTYNADNLIESNVKSGVTFGTSSTGTYTIALNAGYPGSGWTANESGDGSTVLSQANCESVDGAPTGWYWFEDANGDGDTSDSEDGVCVKGANGSAVSWNGAILVNPTVPTNASSTADGGSANTISSSTASWTVNAFKNYTVKITIGAAVTCWGVVKSNTATTTTVYGSWLKTNYTACDSVPDATSGFKIYSDGGVDNSWIGDYTCEGNYPGGTVVPHEYPTTNNSALAQADCYDGKRDLLPNETDRAIISGTVTGTSTNVISDSALATGMVDANAYIGQKVLITGGTGVNSTSTIESNTADSFTVSGWSGTGPDVGSTYKIIYIIPRAYSFGADDSKQYNGPLNIEILKSWKGTRLPTSMDWYGFCGYKDGTSAGTNAYVTATNTLSSSKTYGNFGGQVGRIDELLDLNNQGWEWLSEQLNNSSARSAGGSACSYIGHNGVHGSYRFRAVFRP
jgi:hypothetical protein